MNLKKIQKFGLYLRFPAVFISKILLFALIYWGIFMASPDSFRFSNGYNLTPLTEFWAEFYETDDPAGIQRSDVGDGLSSFQDKAAELNAAYRSWQENLTINEDLEVQYQHVLSEIDKANENAFVAYNEEIIAPLERRLRQDERLLQGLESSEPDYSTVLARIARASGELSQHYDFLLRDRSGFVPSSLLSEEQRLS